MKKNIFRLMLLAAALTMVACDKTENNNGNGDGDGQQISAEKPRSLASANGCVYATCYSPASVIRIDTATCKITGICRLGNFNPEGICCLGNRLYAVSAFISDEQSNMLYDNKVYIIDIATFSLVDSITVKKNPMKIKPLDDSHLVVNSLGDGGATPAQTQLINIINGEVTDLGAEFYNFDIFDGSIYGYTSPYGSLAFHRIDGSNLSHTAIFSNWDKKIKPYSINLNPFNGNFAITTANDFRTAGDCYFFHSDETALGNKIETGMGPSKALFLSENKILVLNEGAWSENNAELTLIDLAANKVNSNYFSAVNGRGLGDVAQDIIVYGSKAYISVTFSNSIEVMNLATGRSRRIATAE